MLRAEGVHYTQTNTIFVDHKNSVGSVLYAVVFVMCQAADIYSTLQDLDYRALKYSDLESFRALKLTNLESFRVRKSSIRVLTESISH